MEFWLAFPAFARPAAAADHAPRRRHVVPVASAAQRPGVDVLSRGENRRRASACPDDGEGTR